MYEKLEAATAPVTTPARSSQNGTSAQNMLLVAQNTISVTRAQIREATGNGISIGWIA
jgi:hypothetical protein